MTRIAGPLAAWLIIAACLAATALTFTDAIAGPAHQCGGYVYVPPRDQGSDLHGGAIGQWLVKCRVTR